MKFYIYRVGMQTFVVNNQKTLLCESLAKIYK